MYLDNAVHFRIVVPKFNHMMMSREQVVGHIIKPVFEKYKKDIRWFWFLNHTVNASEYFGKEKIYINTEWKDEDVYWDGGLLYTICLRFAVKGDKTWDVLKDLVDEAKKHECAIIKPESYDAVADLGGKRFSAKGEDVKRAKLVTQYLHSISQLYMDMLVEQSEVFELEENTHIDNLGEKALDSLHHLFCNTTGFKPVVFVRTETNYDLDLRFYGMNDYYVAKDKEKFKEMYSCFRIFS